MKKLSLILLTTIITAGLSLAQINIPLPSPTATLSQDIGLTNVEIEYSRPGVKGRTIFGDLVPFGEMWRTGANMSTKLTFSDDVMINKKEVPAGTYALYTIPGKDEWTIIIHTNITHGGTGGENYREDEDLMRFVVKPQSLSNLVETFTIDVENNKMDRSDISLSWEKTKVSFTVIDEVKEKIEASIQSTLNPSGGQYYQAANFYHESGQLDNALKHIEISMEKYTESERNAYWAARRKALILADMKKYKEAVAAAEQSSEWAEKAGNNGYVNMNNKSIAEWKKMK